LFKPIFFQVKPFTTPFVSSGTVTIVTPEPRQREGGSPQPHCSQAGPFAQRVGDVFSQSHASLLVKGFENAAQAWLAQAQPCASDLFDSLVPTRLTLRAAFQQSTAHLPQCLVVYIRAIRMVANNFAINDSAYFHATSSAALNVNN
jgi:hypothetical protein